MKKFFLVVLVAFAVVAMCSMVYAEDEYVLGEILVRFYSSASPEQIEAVEMERSLALKLLGRLGPGIRRYQLPEGVSVEEAWRTLNSAEGIYSAVEYAEPNYIYQSQGIPSPADPYFSYKWGLHNTGQRGRFDIDIDLPEAWDIYLPFEAVPVIVAVVDTGIDYYHPDLYDRMWTNAWGYHGRDFYWRDNIPLDFDGHGTLVASIIADIAPKAELMALRVTDPFGNATLWDLIDAFDYAGRNGARIINASLASLNGGYYSISFYWEIRWLDQQGVLVVAAAGNDSSNNDAEPVYPACFDNENIIAVAASGPWDELAESSNYGPGCVDVAGPGVSIFGADAYAGYQWGSGTSAAAPFVAGTAALIMSSFPDLTHRQVKRLILDNVDASPGLTFRVATAGRVNAHKAMQAAAAGSFVYRLYETVLDRGPDPFGFESNVDSLLNQRDGFHLAEIFFFSPEYQNGIGRRDEDFVRHLYRAVFAREPDPDGYAWNLNLIRSGQLTRRNLLWGFAESVEFRNRSPIPRLGQNQGKIRAGGLLN